MLHICCALVVCISCLPRTSLTAEWKPVDIVVSELTKRSIDQMPQDIRVHITGSGYDVGLSMTRGTSSDLPVYLIKNGRVNEVELPSVQQAANYIGVNGRSSMIVRRNETGFFFMDGLFVDGLNESRVISTIIGNFITPEEVNFDNDYVIRPEVEVNLRRVHQRSERQAAIEHTVETLFVADYKDLTYFLKKQHDNLTLAQLEMRLYYSFIADSIMLRFRSLSEEPNGDPNLRVQPLITGLLILDNPITSSFTSRAAFDGKLVAPKALDAFNDWVKRQRGLPPSDHWMLFTGYNLVRGDGTDTVAGLAVLGGLCSRSAVSVVEQSNSASLGATAAHELAHSLGARHDGEDIGCHDSDNYIMSRRLTNPRSEILSSRPWQFSKCSVWRIKQFLSRATCTLKDKFHKSVIRTPPGVFPGQVYKADAQCRMVLGEESYFGRYIQFRKGVDSLCRAMYCYLPGTRSTYRSIFAFEKTSCGDGKWCHKGRCVPSIYAPRTPEYCPQGDDPNSACTKDLCRFIRSKAALASTCCRTCGIIPVIRPEVNPGVNDPTSFPSGSRRVYTRENPPRTLIGKTPRSIFKLADSRVSNKNKKDLSNHPEPPLDFYSNSSVDGVTVISRKPMWETFNRTWNSLFGSKGAVYRSSTVLPGLTSSVNPFSSSRSGFRNDFFASARSTSLMRNGRPNRSKSLQNLNHNSRLGRIISGLGSNTRRIAVPLPRSSGVSTSILQTRTRLSGGSTSVIQKRILGNFGSSLANLRRWRAGSSVGSPIVSSRRFTVRRRVLVPTNSARDRSGNVYTMVRRKSSTRGSGVMNIRGQQGIQSTLRTLSRIPNRLNRLW